MARQAQRCRERLAGLADHGWRQDPDVPPFPDDKPIIVFDGTCVLCSGFARFVAAHDPARQFRFIAAQTPLGAALYRHAGLDPVNYETNLLIANGRIHGKMDAFAGIMRRLGGPWPIAATATWLPAPLADGLYDLVARNRYRLFGRTETCVRPDASWCDRVIDETATTESGSTEWPVKRT
jgi:predicted DCC family thiol-disulfide oxidoreductase YuxK